MGHMPRFSGDRAGQAVEQHGEDRLIGGARRQVDLDLLFQFDDAGGEFQQAKPGPDIYIYLISSSYRRTVFRTFILR